MSRLNKRSTIHPITSLALFCGQFFFLTLSHYSVHQVLTLMSLFIYLSLERPFTPGINLYYFLWLCFMDSLFLDIFVLFLSHAISSISQSLLLSLSIFLLLLIFTRCLFSFFFIIYTLIYSYSISNTRSRGRL